MAYYRTLHLSFWTDPKVDDDFTPEDKYFYLYLLTNPHTNLVGCYEISSRQMERETGYNVDTISRLLKRMEETHKVIRYDRKSKEMLILNWHKYNWTKSPKFLAGAENEAKEIKSEDFKNYIYTVLIPYVYGSDTSVTVTDSVTVSDTNTDNNLDSSKLEVQSKGKNTYAEDSDAYQAACYLARSIKKNYPELKQPEEKDLQRWAADFDKCHRLDKHSWDDISDVLAFSQKDSFWRQNIRSGSKFRDKYETLLIRMKEAENGKSRPRA